jgi:hypothetical protein
MKEHYVHDKPWEDGAEGEWVVCPECGKLFFWELPIYQWKVSHDYVLLCSKKCGLKYFPKHPEMSHGVQKFFKLLAEEKILTPWTWKGSSL